MAPYPLSEHMAAFVEKTLSFNSTDSSLTGLRQAYSEMCRAFTPPSPAMLEVVDFELAGVAVRSWQPPVTPPTNGWPCIMYLHGGGWVVGDLDSHAFICAELASVLGVLVIAVDYRLAPEHPFPAAFDDCLSVWRALRKGPFQLDPARTLVAGDSAGGNLAAALCLALRDAGEPIPCAQVFDLSGTGRRSPIAVAQRMRRCTIAQQQRSGLLSRVVFRRNPTTGCLCDALARRRFQRSATGVDRRGAVRPAAR